MLKIHTAIMIFPPKINAYWKQQCILYKRCLSTTVVQLICNQQVVGSNPTGSLKAHAAKNTMCHGFDSHQSHFMGLQLSWQSNDPKGLASALLKDMCSNMLAEAYPLQLACVRFVCFGASFIKNICMSCFFCSGRAMVAQRTVNPWPLALGVRIPLTAKRCVQQAFWNYPRGYWFDSSQSQFWGLQLNWKSTWSSKMPVRAHILFWQKIHTATI